MRAWFGLKVSDRVLGSSTIDLGVCRMKCWRYFGWTKRTDLSHFGLCSHKNSSVIALFGGMERGKHVLEHTSIKTPEEGRSPHLLFGNSPPAVEPFPLDSAACMRGCWYVAAVYLFSCSPACLSALALSVPWLAFLVILFRYSSRLSCVSVHTDSVFNYLPFLTGSQCKAKLNNYCASLEVFLSFFLPKWLLSH